MRHPDLNELSAADRRRELMLEAVRERRARAHAHSHVASPKATGSRRPIGYLIIRFGAFIAGTPTNGTIPIDSPSS